MRHTSRYTTLPQFPGPVQHGVAKPFAPQPTMQPLPMVSIADSGAIERLRDQGAPYRVSCEVPTQVSRVPAYGAQHEHVRLLLDPVDATADELDLALVEAMLRFGRPTSLAIHYKGKATPDTLDAICDRLASCLHKPASLELSFRGARTAQPLHGMAQLLCTCPGLELVCKEPLAISAAIATLGRCRPGAPQLGALKLVNVTGDDTELIDCLACLDRPGMRIELQLDDADDPDDFITTLLQAGVWTGLQLICHTADGRSATLQGRLDACREAHLDRLLELCTREGRLDHRKLLAHCQTIQGGGAQLFAWACDIEAATAPEHLAQVPLALRSYWRTLRHAQVAHTVCCTLPTDTQFLAEKEVARIVNLKIDFGSLPDGHLAMQTAGTALQRMKELKAGSFHHHGATEAFSNWLFMHLRDLPLERVCFDLGGAACDTSSNWVVDFLSKSSLKTVACHDMQTVCRLAIAMAHFRGSLPWELQLNARPEDEKTLAKSLARIGWKEGLRLVIHFLTDHNPREFIHELHEKLDQTPPRFLVKWVDIASPSYTMPHDSPLLLSIARRHIETAVDSIRNKENRTADFQITQAFLQSIRDADDLEPIDELSSDGEDLDQTATKRLGRLASQLPNLAHVIDSVIDAKVLDKTDMVTLSSINHAARRYVTGTHFPLWLGVQRWLGSMAQMGVPLEQHRAILLTLFNKLTPEHVSDAFLLKGLRSPDEKAEANT